MKYFSLIAIGLLLYACQAEIQPQSYENDPAASTRSVVEGDGFTVEIEAIETGIEEMLYAIENHESDNLLVTAGTGGKIFTSTSNGWEWQQAYQSPTGTTIHSIQAGSWRFAHRWVAAGDGIILESGSGGRGWSTKWYGEDINFYAIGLDPGRMQRDNEFFIGGWGENHSRLFHYYFFDDWVSSHNSFYEGTSPAQHRYTGLSGLSRTVYAVTDRGEFMELMGVWNPDTHLIYFPEPLYAVKVFDGPDEEFGGVPTAYVGGDNGFLARVKDYRQHNGIDAIVDVIPTGEKDRITSIALGGDSTFCVVAGGLNGLFLVSLDGMKFTPVDIGFQGNIQDIVYHKFSESFIVAGGYGRIYHVKITVL